MLVAPLLLVMGCEVRGHTRSPDPFAGLPPPCPAATSPVLGSVAPAVGNSPALGPGGEHFHQAATANPATEEITRNPWNNIKPPFFSLSFLSPQACVNSELAGSSWLAAMSINVFRWELGHHLLW